MTGRDTSPWTAFAAGAVARLALALLVFAWQSRDEGVDAVRTVAVAAQAIPDVEPPTLPEAPRLPDNPMPRPK